MGWTSYHATHYKKNGTIDKKAECDAYFLEGLNRGHYDILKSTMKGNVYYAAVKDLKRVLKDEDGHYMKDSEGNILFEDIEDGHVWGCVFLVSVDNKDYFNFSYKDMDETCGPGYYDCPESILKLLSPTNNEWANEWRKKCREHNDRKKTHNLNDLPILSKIKWTSYTGEELYAVKRAPAYQFKTSWWSFCKGGYIKKKNIPDTWELVEEEKIS